jgi:GNAT superfamily N-acetyltransferase
MLKGKKAFTFRRNGCSTSPEYATICDIEIFDRKYPLVYWLQWIRIRRNYQGRGYGSMLLQSVIDFCVEHEITRLQGKATGDLKRLLPWYISKGFEVDAENNIKLEIHAEH